MSSSLGRHPSDELLQQGPWLQRVARSLVTGEAEAQDLAQDVWVELAGSAAPIRHLQAFTLRIARRLAGARRRSAAARSARERQAARGEALPGSDELASALDTQRMLLAELSALDEVHRTVLLLHYYEGLAAAAIARQRGLAPSTVQSQIRRALEELRARLDRRHAGQRDVWSVLLAPHQRSALPVNKVVLGGMLMTNTLKIPLAVCVAGVLFAVWRLQAVERSLVPAGGDSSPVAVAQVERPAALPAAPASAETADSRTPTRLEPNTESGAEAAADVDLLVIDELTREPLPEYALRVRGEGLEAMLTTDEAGHAALASSWFAAPFQLDALDDPAQPAIDAGTRSFAPEDRPLAGETLVVACACGPTYRLQFETPPPDAAELILALAAGTDFPTNLEFTASVRGLGSRLWARFASTRRQLPSLGDGPWTLSAYAPDGLWRACGPVASIRGLQREPVLLTASPCGALRVTVHCDSDALAGAFGVSVYGLASENARVQWHRNAESGLPPASSGPTTQVFFGHLSPGSYDVWAGSRLYQVVGQRVGLAAGTLAELRLELVANRELAALRVVVSSESGLLAMSPQVRVRHLATNTLNFGVWQSQESTPTRSVLLFEGLEPGEHEFELQGIERLPPLWSPGTRQIALAAGPDVVFNCLDLHAPPMLSAQLRIRARDGSPIRGAGVTSYFDGQRSFLSESDAEGVVHLEPILAGARFDLAVLADGYRPLLLRDLCLPLVPEDLELHLDSGWGALLEVVYPRLDSRTGAQPLRPAPAIGALIALDGEPVGALDERGQLLLQAESCPSRIEVCFPGYQIAYGDIQLQTGAPTKHSNTPYWVVLEPSASALELPPGAGGD